MFANCLTRKKSIRKSNKIFSEIRFFQIRSITVKFLIIILHKCNSLLHFSVHSEKAFFSMKSWKNPFNKKPKNFFFLSLTRKEMFNNNEKFAFEKLNKMIGVVLKPFLNTELKILLNLKNISFLIYL